MIVAVVRAAYDVTQTISVNAAAVTGGDYPNIVATDFVFASTVTLFLSWLCLSKLLKDRHHTTFGLKHIIPTSA